MIHAMADLKEALAASLAYEAAMDALILANTPRDLGVAWREHCEAFDDDTPAKEKLRAEYARKIGAWARAI